MSVALVQAFAAGVLSFLSPCSIAMLPAWISHYVAHDDRYPGPRTQRPLLLLLALTTAAVLALAGAAEILSIGRGHAAFTLRAPALLLGSGSVVVFAAVVTRSARILRGASFGLATGAGMMGAFALVGLPFVGILQWLTFEMQMLLVAGVGATLVALGALGFAGRGISYTLPLSAPRGRDARSFALFGAAYGLVAMGCNLPLFLIAVVGPLVGSQDLLSASAGLIGYAGGMATVMVVMSVMIATSREAIAAKVRGSARYTTRVANVFLILSGTYITHYAWRALSGA